MLENVIESNDIELWSSGYLSLNYSPRIIEICGGCREILVLVDVVNNLLRRAHESRTGRAATLKSLARVGLYEV